jgi:hypothetical protein
MLRSLIILSYGGILAVPAQTVLHYRVFDTDAVKVAGNAIPGVDGAPDGEVFAGTVTLSEDIPSESVPRGSGNRSLVFDGANGINLPGTQQLLNSAVDTAGGFTFEAWYKFTGGGNVNSIIDYAGTEKLVRRAASTGVSMTAAGVGDPLIGATALNEWHYVAVVFTSTGLDGASINGDFTFYLDRTMPVGTADGVTIDDFGDSLDRTISVGAHPLGFSGDFITGLIYEPRVSLGALKPNELLFGGSVEAPLVITNIEQIQDGNSVTWNSRAGASYRLEYSFNLEEWLEITDTIPAASETTVFEHLFSPEFEELADETKLFYRVLKND